MPAAHPQPGTSLDEAFSSALQSRTRRQLRRQLTRPRDGDGDGGGGGGGHHDFSSNDFLSLSHSPLFRARLLDRLAGPSPPQGLASGGSRLLDGNSALAEEVERRIATFHQAEAALLFNSGYAANVGVVSCVPQPGDVVLYDALIHASLHDGMRLSRASQTLPFAHNDADALRRLLAGLVARDRAIADGRRNVFVALESVYSMDGDVAPIRRLADVVNDLLPHRNGHLIIDEAHATGVLGARGAGLVQSLDMQHRFLIRIHTFGKALAAHGAVVLCSAQTRDYLINYARSLIFTTALPFAALASIQIAYDLIDSPECDELRNRLRHLEQHCARALSRLPTPTPTSTTTTTRTTTIPRAITISHEPGSAIFALRTPDAVQLAAHCQARGFMVRAVRPPTVPVGTERVRLCLHAANSPQTIDQLVACVEQWVRAAPEPAPRL